MRRFKKLEKRSPDMDAPPTSAPILHPRPTKRPAIAVIRKERKIPRMVFDAPKTGCPSGHLAPLSRGCENRLPKILFASKGVPFASISRNSNRTIIPGGRLSVLESRAPEKSALTSPTNRRIFPFNPDSEIGLTDSTDSVFGFKHHINSPKRAVLGPLKTLRLV
jgi:hypothetical protein